MKWTLTIPGVPRTKKNSGRIVPRGRSHIILPSEAWAEWCAAVAPRLQRWMQSQQLSPIARPVNCAALFYRDALRGDAVGFYQGLADVLQKGGVVVDDKWIVSWDGSRLMKDADRPRVELTLTSAEETQNGTEDCCEQQP
jgi:Holliday junction resolvase RusA-like endonuclease